MTKERSRTSLRDEADKHAVAYCRAFGACAAYGYNAKDCPPRECGDRIEWAHVKSRGEEYIRHWPENALPLCNGHHRFFTGHPDAWYRFVETVRPGLWDRLNGVLNDRRDAKVKVNLKDVFRDWTAWYKNGAIPGEEPYR